MPTPGPRSSRSRRDDLFSKRKELRYGGGYFNDREITYFEGRRLSTDGDLCTHCEYALLETLWPPVEVDGIPYDTGCLGWMDCIMSTATCTFCAFLTKLFFDASSGFSGDQIGRETNKRRICLWLDWEAREEVSSMQLRKNQWHGDFAVVVQELDNSDPEPGSFTPYEGVMEHQLAFRLDVGSKEDFISLMGTQSEEAAVLNLSRPIGRHWNSAIFRDALNACRKHHGERCEAPQSAFASAHHTLGAPAAIGERLLVVDVLQECIASLPTDSSYVALSYCWSNKPYSVLTLTNHQELSIPGTLRSLFLAPTISDAMIATRAIGEQYLWVDSLCIVQDDFENKTAELARMDDIYRAASLTIIAAATPLNGSEVGLPGVRAATARSDAATIEIRGLTFRQCRLSLWDGLAASRWQTRAWTLQEYLLSKRYLIFMPEQVYFVCRTADFAEDHIDHVCVKSERPNEQALQPCCDLTVYENRSNGKESHSPLHTIDSYRELVEVYTRREMSFDADGVNAARGMLRLLQQEYGIAFLCGLPVPHLIGYFLTWVPLGPSVRRKPLPPGKGRILSWTWAGWRGKATYPGPSTNSPESDEHPDDGTDDTGMHVELEQDITKWKVMLPLDDDSPGSAVHIDQSQDSIAKLASIDHCFLKFAAEVACFSVRADAYGIPAHDLKRGKDGGSTGHQINANGVWVGSVILHCQQEDAPLDIERLGSSTFVALSRAKARWRIWVLTNETEPSDEGSFRYAKDDTFEVVRPPFDKGALDVKGSVVNVLLVHNSKTGIMYRIGVGQIHADAWDAAEPQRKQIILG
jgi:hypothetical protein